MTDKANPPATRDARALQIESAPEQTRGQAAAHAIATPWLASTAGAYGFASGTMGETDMTELAMLIRKQAKAISEGDMAGPEMMLASQAMALNLIFGDMARRADMNRADYPLAFDRYIKVAMKAQAQCRATLETLAAIKNPPVVYARQANIAHGPQQVNNAANTRGRAPARGKKNQNAPNGLLEGAGDDE